LTLQQRGTGIHHVAAALFNRQGLAGYRFLVHGGDTFRDLTVDGDQAPRINNDGVVHRQLAHGHFDFLTVAQQPAALGLIIE
jgi:hypothetical protein